MVVENEFLNLDLLCGVYDVFSLLDNLVRVWFMELFLISGLSSLIRE